MLNELIENIGMENINKFLENDITIKNSVLIKVTKDGVSDVLVVEKETMENLELQQWFKQRICYSEVIKANKCIVQGKFYSNKLYSSANCNSIIFNINTLTNKVETLKKKELDIDAKELFKISIEEYLTKLNVEINTDIFYIYYKEIYEEFSKYNGKKVIVMKDESIEQYRVEFDKYLDNYMYNNKDKTYVIDNKEYRMYPGFINTNVDKIYLMNVGGIIPNLQLHTQEETNVLYKLNKYLLKLNGYHMTLHNQYNGNIYIEKSMSDSSISIDNYEYVPGEYKDSMKTMYIHNILSANKDSYTITQYSKLFEIINRYTDYSLNKEEKDSNKKILYMKYNKMIKSKKYTDAKNVFIIINTDFLKKNISNILKDIIKYNELNKSKNCKKGIKKFYHMREIINFSICVDDYFNKDEGVKNIMDITQSLKDKMAKIKENGIVFENSKEMMYMAGQLGYYLVSKSKTSHRTNNLLSMYHNAKSYEGVLRILQRDMGKYAHEIYLNSRENIIFATLMNQSNKTGKLSKEDTKYYLAGIYADNIFFNKKEEN